MTNFTDIWVYSDEDWRREYLIDDYVSMIWTQRYLPFGDFELVTPDTRKFRNILKIGTRVYKDYTRQDVMRVQNIERYTSEEGEALIKFTGNSMEELFEYRTAFTSLTGLETNPKLELTGTPQDIIKQLVDTACLTAPIDPNDVMSLMDLDGVEYFPGLPFPTEVVTIAFDPTSLWKAVKKVLTTYKLGFNFSHPRTRISGEVRTPYLACQLYTGNDRTSRQTENPPVVFSPELDNLSSERHFNTDVNFRNVAYVFAKNGAGIVYGDITDPSVTGTERRVMTVNASDIDLAAGTALDAAIQQRGKEELAKQKHMIAYDGQIPVNATVPEYFLGDLVEQRDNDGTASAMMVTEIIDVCDKEGTRTYPTLEVDSVTTPGTWAARPLAQVWDQVPETEHWGDL